MERAGLGLASLLLGGTILLGSVNASAQVTIPQEYEKTVKAAGDIGAFGNDLFGEQVSLYTGATTFQAVDVSLPGNNGLSVEIRRSFSVESRDGPSQAQLLTRDGTFADWDLDIPYLSGIFALGLGWQVDGITAAGKVKRCTLSAANSAEPPVMSGSPGGFWAPTEYWHGNSLHIPGEGNQEMMLIAPENPSRPGDGKTYVWITNNQWYFSCLSQTANGVAGEAFLAIDPAGRRYYFDWVVSRPAPYISKPYGGIVDPLSMGAGNQAQPAAAPSPSTSGLTRDEVRFLPTRIQDRFGNYVTYAYDAAHPWRLLSISASDGRSIALSYDAAGHISSVTAGTRTWTYVYGNGLTEVRLPDQSKWTMDFSDLRAMRTLSLDEVTALCENTGSSPVQPLRTGTITHPSGAVGTFSFRSKTHGRSYVPKQCINPSSASPNNNFALYPYLFDIAGIEKKQIAGSGMGAVLSWTYSFGPLNKSWQSDCASGCVATKTLEITGPDNSWERHTFGNRFRYNEGRLLKVERGSGPSSIVDVAQTDYQVDASGQNYPARVGLNIYGRGDGMSERLMPVRERTQIRQDRVFSWEVPATCGSSGTALCFDQYARPTKVTRSSAPSP